jgi:hypothetical protein
VTGGTLFREPFTKTSQGDTSRPPDNDIGVVETSFNSRPKTVDMRPNVLATTFDSDTESHEGRLSHSRIGRAHVDLELGREDREDLLGRKGLGEGVKTSERELLVSFAIRLGICSLP